MPKEISEITREKVNDMFNRSTLEVAKSIIDDEKINTRSKKYLKEEARLGFLSVWTAFNTCFSAIIDIYEDTETPDHIKKKFENLYKGLPVGFNLPLEHRIPPEVRKSKLTDGEKAAREAGAPGPIIVKGYNDPESLEEWAKFKEEQEHEQKDS